MRYMVTGGCGFMGTNMSLEILKDLGNELLILDDLSRLGSRDNLAYLKTVAGFVFKQIDICDTLKVDEVICDYKPDVIFHLAGQVAMTTSIEDPLRDFKINALGTLNVLEAIRCHSPESILIYSSTNKVYGDLDQYEYTETDTRYVLEKLPNGFNEDIQLHFSTPYGCSKGSADQYVLDYAKLFDLKTVVFRHSSAFGLRQFSNFDQGWVGWFARQALNTQKGNAGEPFTIAGNGKQVRDILFSKDVVSCYFSAVEHIDVVRGEVFNIGGGVDNSLSILELFSFFEKELNITLKYEELPFRKSDQKIFVADISKAKKLLHWSPSVSAIQGLREMIKWIKKSEE